MRKNGQSRSLGTSLAQKPSKLPKNGLPLARTSNVIPYVRTPQQVQNSPLISSDPLGEASGQPYGYSLIQDALSALSQGQPSPQPQGVIPASPNAMSYTPKAGKGYADASLAQLVSPYDIGQGGNEDEATSKLLAFLDNYKRSQPTLVGPPSAPEFRQLPNAPVVDQQGNDEKYQNALHAGLIAQALGALTGNSGIYGPGMITSALQGEKAGIDEGFNQKQKLYDQALQLAHYQNAQEQDIFGNERARRGDINSNEIARVGGLNQEGEDKLRGLIQASNIETRNNALTQKGQTAVEQQRRRLMNDLSKFPADQQEGQLLKDPSYAKYGITRDQFLDANGNFRGLKPTAQTVREMNAKTAETNAKTGAKRAGIYEAVSKGGLRERIRHNKVIEGQGGERINIAWGHLKVAQDRLDEIGTMKDPQKRIDALFISKRKHEAQRELTINKFQDPLWVAQAAENPALVDNANEVINAFDEIIGVEDAALVRANNELAKKGKQGSAITKATSSSSSSSGGKVGGNPNYTAASGRSYSIEVH